MVHWEKARALPGRSLCNNQLYHLLILRCQASPLAFLRLSLLICYMEIALVKTNTVCSIETIFIINFRNCNTETCSGKGVTVHTQKR